MNASSDDPAEPHQYITLVLSIVPLNKQSPPLILTTCESGFHCSSIDTYMGSVSLWLPLSVRIRLPYRVCQSGSRVRQPTPVSCRKSRMSDCVISGRQVRTNLLSAAQHCDYLSRLSEITFFMTDVCFWDSDSIVYRLRYG
jgi:hypothetical protein